MERYDYCVIGSGISGMLYAHNKAKSAESILVLEKSPTAGGCLHTMRHEDFWLELGGHTVYSSYATLVEAMTDLGLSDNFLERIKVPIKILFDEGLVPAMSTLNKVQLALNIPKVMFIRKDGRTVKQYYSAILGKNNYENMFRHMARAVISQEASDFPADILLKNRPKNKNLPNSFTIKGGMNKIIEAISNEEKITVVTGQEVITVAKQEDGFQITTAAGESYRADNITFACPPPVASALLKETAGEISEILATIQGSRIESMGVIIPRDKTELEPFSFIIPSDDDYNSIVSRDVVEDTEFRGFAFHFIPDRLDREGKIAKVEEVLGCSRDDFVAVEEVTHFSPSLTLGHKDRITALDNAIEAADGIQVVGNFFGGLALEDCATEASRA